jgi:hypothetical protein
MISNFQLAVGDVCGDPTGLRVKVVDVDVYDYVHFSVLEANEAGDEEPETGQMSHDAFAHRFTRVGRYAS